MSLRGGAALLVLCTACGSSSTTQGSSSAAPSSAKPSTSTAVGPGAPKAVCDIAGGSDHVCFELDDDELAAERESTCSGRFARAESCPRVDVLSVCLLPEGSRRFGYPPKTITSHEKACKELQGRFAAGSTPPPPDPVVMVSCEGKYPNACEEEEAHTVPRVAAAQEECRDFGGTFRKGGGCGRADARYACDLQGKRTIISRLVTTAEAGQRFCTERGGKFIDLAPSPAASASAGPSASAAVDLDPPEPKPDVVIRQQ